MKKFLSILALGALTLTGCGSGSEEDPTPGPSGKDAVTFAIGDKTIEGASGLDGSLGWKNGDLLGIYCSRIAATANYKAAFAGNVIASTFKFNGTEDHTFYLYAPYNTSGSLSNKSPKITAELPATQQSATAVADHALVYAKATVSPSDGTQVSAEFSHAFAYAGFKVSAAAQSTYKLKSVMIQAAGATLSGAYTADFQASAPVRFDSGASNSLKVLTGAQAPVMSSPQTVYAVVNPQTAKDFEITVDLENPATGSVERFTGKVTGKAFPVQTLTTLEIDVASLAAREDIDIDFGQTSALLWGGLASIEHANVSVLRNDVRTAPESYGIRYRKAGSSDQWVVITAVDGKSSTPSLAQGQTYDYEVWVKFAGKTYNSGEILHFTEGVESRNFYKKSLAMKFTGLWCHNCPAMTFGLEEAQKLWSDRIEGLEFHVDQGNIDPYQVESAAKFISRYGVSAYPHCIMDSRGGIGNGQPSTIAPIIANTAKESLQEFAPACGITFSSELNNRTLTVKTKTYVKTSDTYLLNVVLVEDITTTQQAGFDGEFPLHNVARIFMTDILGETMAAEAGTIKEKTFTCTLPASAVPANCKVLVYVMRKYNSEHPYKESGVTGVTSKNYFGYYVDNCNTAAVGTQTLLRYEDQ